LSLNSKPYILKDTFAVLVLTQSLFSETEDGEQVQ